MCELYWREHYVMFDLHLAEQSVSQYEDLCEGGITAMDVSCEGIRVYLGAPLVLRVSRELYPRMPFRIA